MSSICGRLPSKVVFHLKLSSIEGCLPSKVVFHLRSSSTKGHLTSKVVFHKRSSSIKGPFLSMKVVFQRKSSLWPFFTFYEQSPQHKIDKPFKIKPWKKFEYCNFSVCLDQDQSLRKMLIHPHHHHIWKSLYFYLSMDTPIYLPTMKFLVQTFILEKVWLEDTLPTFSLDICLKFHRFFLTLS